MEIISKFVIGSDKGVSDFLNVKINSFIHLHKDFIKEEEIKKYIEEHFDERKIINELNDLSNQLIITYKENLPVAYCMIKSGSRHSAFLQEKRTTEIDFAILPEHNLDEIKTSLFTKLLSAAKFTDIIWINVLQNNHTVDDFLRTKGFEFVENSFSEKFKLDRNLLSLKV